MIDIIIPCIESDLLMLKLCLESIRKNVVEQINTIYIISPDSQIIKNFCNKNKCIFIDEQKYIGFSKDELNLGERNGWMYQQLLKLNGNIISECDNFLVIDSDHVLLKKHNFLENDKFVFYMSEEYHKPYFDAINLLFKGEIKKETNKSFISDKMIFNKDILLSMKEKIEHISKSDWINSIINSYSHFSYCGFSEFETYGNFFCRYIQKKNDFYK